MAGFQTSRERISPQTGHETADEATDSADVMGSEMEDDKAKDGGVPLPASVQEHLGRQLRAAYSALVNEPLPDKLADLLRKLESKQRDLE